MEPTIYKPSIYKGAGINKAGAGGGGGGGDISDKEIYSIISRSSFYYIDLNNSFSKTNLSIKVVFSAGNVGSNSNIIEFLNNNDITSFISKTSKNNLRVSNSNGGGDDTALDNSNYSVVMKGKNYRKMWAGATSNYDTAFSNNSINRIGIGKNVDLSRITLFEGGMEIDSNSNILIDLRPSKQEGEKGLIDVVNGDFYKVTTAQVL